MGAGDRGQVLLVEDDDAVREGVAAALGSHGFDVIARPDGDDFDDVVVANRPDLVVLDVGLPGARNGFDLAAHLRRAGDLPLIFLTAADAEEDRLRGFQVGCDDYLVKPFSVRELIVRIEAVLRRVGSRSGDARLGDLEIDTRARVARRAGAPLDLTPTEFDLLAALSRTPGEPWAKPDLQRAVWGYDGAGGHVVEVHVSALRRKLERHGPRNIVTVRGGYVLRSA